MVERITDHDLWRLYMATDCTPERNVLGLKLFGRSWSEVKVYLRSAEQDLGYKRIIDVADDQCGEQVHDEADDYFGFPEMIWSCILPRDHVTAHIARTDGRSRVWPKMNAEVGHG